MTGQPLPGRVAVLPVLSLECRLVRSVPGIPWDSEAGSFPAVSVDLTASE
ncbi:hypothetical protein GCM10009603_50800 [Nocardiopsis exhalans]